mgnify:CR=1 FL=1
MKTTTINMAEVGDENPFFTAKWEDVSPEKEKEVYAILSNIGKST